ncbi:energy transducer TonB [Edaphobacter modestus]|uniref:TonB family protein n=1 Tax=Edaphobacter modestus TaxID=388466 RepID=A0A4Q7XZ21_9BACT|nr:energy transducer TonB [Edaphobacter modestus]RZU29041.1 TonB family protein [Edaphobacter modestus]
MTGPLRRGSQPQNRQFLHFGVLDNGSQCRGSIFTSVTANVTVAIAICLVSAAAKKTIDTRHKLEVLSMAPLPKPIELIRPKIIPPKPIATPSAKVDPPHIKIPEVKLPDIPQPQPFKMVQQPPILPALAQFVQPPPAPKVVNLSQPQPASVINNAPHPTPVSLGQQNNPVISSDNPATNAINLGQRGLAGMSSNTGLGPKATAVHLGSGSTSSQNLNGHDKASKAVNGVKLGVGIGTGSTNALAHVAGPVNLGQYVPPPMPKSSGPTPQQANAAPKVLFKPRPEYTSEAIKLHIEGTISVRLRVAASGAVQVLSVINDLGHGLGDSAVRAVQTSRFQPALNSSGHPIDWEGVVNVVFQLAN